MIQTGRRNCCAFPQPLSDSTNKFSGLPGAKKLPFVSLWSNLCFGAWCSEQWTPPSTHLCAARAACSSQNGREGHWPFTHRGSHRLGLCPEEKEGMQWVVRCAQQCSLGKRCSSKALCAGPCRAAPVFALSVENKAWPVSNSWKEVSVNSRESPFPSNTLPPAAWAFQWKVIWLTYLSPKQNAHNPFFHFSVFLSCVKVGFSSHTRGDWPVGIPSLPSSGLHQPREFKNWRGICGVYGRANFDF